MLQDVSGTTFQFDDVSFRHNLGGTFSEHILGVCTHIAVELAFGSNLVNAVDVVVHLVRQQLLNDLNTSHLSKDDIRKDWSRTRLVILIIRRIVVLLL